jgi:hypothetical protein
LVPEATRRKSTLLKKKNLRFEPSKNLASDRTSALKMDGSSRLTSYLKNAGKAVEKKLFL